MLKLIVYFGVLLALTEGLRHGFNISINGAGIDTLMPMSLKSYEADLQKTFGETPVNSVDLGIGNISYGFKGIRLSKFAIPSISLAFLQGPTLGIKMSTKDMTLSTGWSYDVKLLNSIFGDHVSGDINLKGIKLGFAAKIGLKNGVPFLRAEDCYTWFGEFTPKFTGKMSGLYTFTAKIVGDELKNLVGENFCKLAKKTINGAATFQSFFWNARSASEKKLVYQVVEKLKLFGLTEFGEDTETEGGKEIMDITGSRPFLTDSAEPPSNKMASVQIYDYMINSAAGMFQDLPQLQQKVTQKDLPPPLRPFLRTRCAQPFGLCVGMFMGEVAKKYPEGSTEIHIYPDKSQLFKTVPHKVAAQLGVRADFVVRAEGGNMHTLFSNIIGLKAALVPKIEGSRLKFRVRSLRSHIDLQHQAGVDRMMEAPLRILLNQVAKSVIVPTVNAVLQEGFEIPDLAGYHFNNTDIKLGKGYILMGSDFKHL